jgi:hypothetical protein
MNQRVRQVEEGHFVVDEPVAKGTKLVQIPTELVVFCEDIGRCLTSSAGSNEKFVVVSDYVLPPSQTMEGWDEQLCVRDEVTMMIEGVGEEMATALDKATTTLERDSFGTFWACAARDLQEGEKLTRYARVHEQLLPILNEHIDREWMQSAIFMESVIEILLARELDMMAQLSKSVFGPVIWNRQLPVPIDAIDGHTLVCPLDNDRTPTEAECAHYLRVVFGHQAGAGEARDELLMRVVE